MPDTPKFKSMNSTIVQKELLPYLSRINTKDYFDHMESKALPELHFQRSRRWAHRILHIAGFDYFMGAVIVANLVVMIVETDRSTEDDETSSEGSVHWTGIFGWAALSIFVFELSVRMFVFRYYFWKDAWNVFDFIIVATDLVFSMIGLFAANLFPVSILRIFRLAKLARVSKILRVFPELRLLMAGLMSSISAIFWGTLLLFFCLLVWSMVAVLFIHPINKNIFYKDCDRCERAYGSVFQATLTFWQQIVCGDSWGQVTVPIIEREPSTAIFFALVYLSIGMAVMNLILGVVVNVAQQATIDLQEEDNTEKALFKLEQQTNLLELCKQMDSTNNGELTHDEILAGFEEPGEFRDIILALDITKEEFDIVWTILDTEKRGSVSYKELVSHLCTMQSSDAQFMLAYIKYYITLIRNTLLENHDEAMRMERRVVREVEKIEAQERRVEQEITKIEQQELLIREDLERPRRRTLRSVLTPTHREDDKKNLPCNERPEMPAESGCQEVGGEISQLTEDSTYVEQVSSSPIPLQNESREHANIDGVTTAHVSDEMQSWFVNVSLDIEKWRAELEKRLQDIDLKFSAQLKHASVINQDKVSTKAPPQSAVVQRENTACSVLPSCFETEMPTASDITKQQDAAVSAKRGSLNSQACDSLNPAKLPLQSSRRQLVEI